MFDRYESEEVTFNFDSVTGELIGVMAWDDDYSAENYDKEEYMQLALSTLRKIDPDNTYALKEIIDTTRSFVCYVFVREVDGVRIDSATVTINLSSGKVQSWYSSGKFTVNAEQLQYNVEDNQKAIMKRVDELWKDYDGPYFPEIVQEEVVRYRTGEYAVLYVVEIAFGGETRDACDRHDGVEMVILL